MGNNSSSCKPASHGRSWLHSITRITFESVCQAVASLMSQQQQLATSANRCNYAGIQDVPGDTAYMHAQCLPSGSLHACVGLVGGCSGVDTRGTHHRAGSAERFHPAPVAAQGCSAGGGHRRAVHLSRPCSRSGGAGAVLLPAAGGHL